MITEPATRFLTSDSVSSWLMKPKLMLIKCKQDMMGEHQSEMLSGTLISQLAQIKVKTWAISKEFLLILKILSAQQLV